MAMTLKSLKLMRNVNNCYHQISNCGDLVSSSKVPYKLDAPGETLIQVNTQIFDYLNHRFTFVFCLQDNAFCKAGEIISTGWHDLTENRLQW